MNKINKNKTKKKNTIKPFLTRILQHILNYETNEQKKNMYLLSLLYIYKYIEIYEKKMYLKI